MAAPTMMKNGRGSYFPGTWVANELVIESGIVKGARHAET